MEDLVLQVKGFYTWLVLGVASFFVFIAVAIAAIVKNEPETLKKILFGLIVVPIVLATFYLIASTIYLNRISVTGGPVHYHADFEVWVCGQEIDLIDPKWYSNKVGTPVLHEHNDKRIHVEGVVIDWKDISLGEFFRVVGGALSNTSFTIPTNVATITVENGRMCSGEEGEVQVFTYQTEGDEFWQEKLENPAEYVLSPQTLVPPGDCIIVEFDAPKGRTDKLCQQYEVKKSLGEIYER